MLMVFNFVENLYKLLFLYLYIRIIVQRRYIYDLINIYIYINAKLVNAI